MYVRVSKTSNSWKRLDHGDDHDHGRGRGRGGRVNECEYVVPCGQDLDSSCRTWQ